MAPPLRDTLSLRPQGFLGIAFLLARLATIIALVPIIGITASFIVSMTNAGQDLAPAASLVATLVFTGTALLWTCLSWSGYSRRYFSYGWTATIDLLFLIPFVIIALVLGIPLDSQIGTCSAFEGDFSISLPLSQNLNFPNQDGKGICLKLFSVWGLLVAVCALLAISALAVGFLGLGERQLARAI
ncbi:hypothetical protein QBC46DRAFT_243118, partial [Diplogelasinospora grovesii]